VFPSRQLIENSWNKFLRQNFVDNRILIGILW
jgi:hypothetical protein